MSPTTTRTTRVIGPSTGRTYPALDTGEKWNGARILAFTLPVLTDLITADDGLDSNGSGLLAAEDERDVLHMVLASMGIACGRDLLDLCKTARINGTRLTTLTSAETTCPDCLATGDHAAQCKAMQSHQAPTAG